MNPVATDETGVLPSTRSRFEGGSIGEIISIKKAKVIKKQ